MPATVKPLRPSAPTPAIGRAILLVGWAGALRRSEIVSIEFDDVAFGEHGVTIRLRQTKGSQDTVVTVDIPKAKNEEVCPVLALPAWLDLGHITEGPVFRGMRKGDHLSNGRLSDRHVDGIIRRLAGSEYSGHSLRAGWCTAAGRAGALLPDSMRHSRHKSERVLRSAISALVGAGSITPARTCCKLGHVNGKPLSQAAFCLSPTVSRIRASDTVQSSPVRRAGCHRARIARDMRVKCAPVAPSHSRAHCKRPARRKTCTALSGRGRAMSSRGRRGRAP